MKRNLRDLYLEQLQDLYSAETQLVEVLPRMAMKAADQPLKKAFSEHLEETKEHLFRLEEIFERHPSVKPDGHKCKAMKGLVAEGQQSLEDTGISHVLDIGLVAAARRIEHYEIAAYDVAIQMADALNEKEDARLLRRSRFEESRTDRILTRLSKGGMFADGLIKVAV